MEIQSNYKASEGMTYRRKSDNEIVGSYIILSNDDTIDNYEEVVDEEYKKMKEERNRRIVEMREKNEKRISKAREEINRKLEEMRKMKEDMLQRHNEFR